MTRSLETARFEREKTVTLNKISPARSVHSAHGSLSETFAGGISVRLPPGTGHRQVSEVMSASDESLVECAQSGGHWAYVELCRRNHELIFAVVQRVTRNSHDTEDVLQDTWMNGFTHIKTFDRRAAFSTWLTRIAINCAFMMLRKRRRRLETSLDDRQDSQVSGKYEIVESSTGPEAALLYKERHLLMRQAIACLPPRLRLVAELRQSTDGSLKEIATLAGISVPSTKSRLTRAKFALRRSLKQA